MLCLVEAAPCCSMASWCLLVLTSFYIDIFILCQYCCLLLRCKVSGDAALYISNTMHLFRFYSSLCPRCCYYQSWHHSFNMMGLVFPFICNGQETLNHFIFQAQQHLFFKEWFFSPSISCFLSCLISCALYLFPNHFTLHLLLPCFIFSSVSTFFSLSPLTLPIFVPVQGTDRGLLQSTKRFHWPYQALGYHLSILILGSCRI